MTKSGLVGSFKAALKRPFQNLNTIDRIVQALRLTSSLMVIILGLVSTIGAVAYPDTLYAAKFTTARDRIANGLFKMLSSNVGPVDGLGLTSSEVVILTQYTSSRVQDVPAYVLSGVYGLCRVSSVVPEQPTDNCTCTTLGEGYVLDYRELLRDIGLNIVLEYTYRNRDGAIRDSDGRHDDSPGVRSSTDDSTYRMPDYISHMEHVSKTKRQMIQMLYAVMVLEFLSLVGMFHYYSIKGKMLSTYRERAMVHLLSLTSLVILNLSLVAVIKLVLLFKAFQNQVTKELKEFGFAYELGGNWFICLGTLVGFSFVSFLVWTGLEWCIMDPDSGVQKISNMQMSVATTAVPGGYAQKVNNTTLDDPLPQTTLLRVEEPTPPPHSSVKHLSVPIAPPSYPPGMSSASDVSLGSSPRVMVAASTFKF
ncbi:AER134Wp [Eremothecium gossypii ATCC 10895]|uniref:AER134Wp n=1 Tax=Eremothecium gossypii (strain ATCC 10895 / CBS 109.51 / FGSC 9923 / NRRL Y-1056) TaxID=284811 RepID=Q756Y0_EREGS|nr:AER134Wp [Eremothecium gossypii ATCC 10895]AAS52817.2 AER134Wp [Eremothecium gossypii ATCC 10895]AEY97123.1 FAER134Wp [Eremothecium gossypii FDAG1]